LLSDRTIAAVTALLFAVHPVHAEAVAGIVGRAEILAAGFLLLGMLAMLPRGDAFTPARAGIAALFFLGALLSKETAVCYPALAAAVWLHRARSAQRDSPATGSGNGRARTASLVLNVVILAAPLLLYFPARYVALEQHLLRQRASASLFNPLVDADVWGRVHGPLTVLGHYARLLFIPSTLSCDYGLAVINPPAGPELLTGVGLVALIVLLVLTAGWLRYVFRPASAPATDGAAGAIGLMASLFVVSYVLISNTVLLIGVSLAERLMYWPSVPALAALAIASVRLWRRHAGPGGALEGLTRALPLLGVVLLVGLGARSCGRNLDWQSDRTLFEADVATYPQDAHLNVALARLKVFDAERLPPQHPQREDLLKSADTNIANALNVSSRFPSALQQKAIICELRGDSQNAAMLYELVLQLYPSDRRSQARLARLRGDSPEKQARLKALLESIAANPSDTAARLEAGELLLALSQNFPALQQFEEAARLTPDDTRAVRGLGRALIANRQEDRAREVLLRAVALDPGDWEMHVNLAALLEHSDPPGSLVHAQKAHQLQPADVRVQIALATACSLNGRTNEALELYQKVLKALPADHPLRRPVEDRIREIRK
jgi:Flp pilus assembly protein TadD